MPTPTRIVGLRRAGARTDEYQIGGRVTTGKMTVDYRPIQAVTGVWDWADYDKSGTNFAATSTLSENDKHLGSIPPSTAITDTNAYRVSYTYGQREVPLQCDNSGILLVNQGGVPTAMFGPGSIDQAHSENEFVEAKQLINTSRVYAQTIVELLG